MSGKSSGNKNSNGQDQYEPNNLGFGPGNPNKPKPFYDPSGWFHSDNYDPNKPWESYGMSYADYMDKYKPTLSSLGIDPGQWEDFKKTTGAVGTPGVPRGEENPGLLDAFYKWRAKRNSSESMHNTYATLTARSPGREQSVIAGNSPMSSIIGG